MILSKPPHRWLRNSLTRLDLSNNSKPPHRWLRKTVLFGQILPTCKPPHRWLRNKSVKLVKLASVNRRIGGLEIERLRLNASCVVRRRTQAAF